MHIIFYNGDFIDSKDVCIPIDNRAFNYGDGFFETIKIINSVPFNFSAHLLRMNCALELLKMDNVYSDAFLSDKISKLIEYNNILDGIVKIHVSRRGAGSYFPSTNSLDLLISIREDLPYQYNPSLSLSLYHDIYKPANSFANLKSVNALTYVLASVYANENNFDDAILLNTDLNILESSNANIFIVKDNMVYTPSLVDGCVRGTMRSLALKQFNILEKSISKSEIKKADEVFISNATRGFTSVHSIDNMLFSSSAIADSFQEKLINLSSGL